MILVALSAVVLFVALCCFALVAIHAFNRSLGTGFMVLCIPVYNVVYGFSQFEHRRKGLVLAGWLGGFVLGIILRVLGFAMLINQAPN